MVLVYILATLTASEVAKLVRFVTDYCSKLLSDEYKP